MMLEKTVVSTVDPGSATVLQLQEMGRDCCLIKVILTVCSLIYFISYLIRLLVIIDMPIVFFIIT